jgi:hypothetical protein
MLFFFYGLEMLLDLKQPYKKAKMKTGYTL